FIAHAALRLKKTNRSFAGWLTSCMACVRKRNEIHFLFATVLMAHSPRDLLYWSLGKRRVSHMALSAVPRLPQESGYSCIARGWWNDKRLCTTSDSINSQNSWWNTPFA